MNEMDVFELIKDIKVNDILNDRSVLCIHGSDVRSFFHKIFTQDFLNLSPDCVVYSLFLTPNGLYLHDFFVYFTRDEYCYVDINSDDVVEFINTLDKYKFRANVNIEHTDYKIYCSTEVIKDCVFFGMDPRISTIGYRYIVKKEFFMKHQLYDIEGANYDLLRMLLTLPDSMDMEKERAVPIQYNMKQINGIAFGKGCYIGQEFTNRSHTSGVVRKCFSTIVVKACDDNQEAAGELLDDSLVVDNISIMHFSAIKKLSDVLIGVGMANVNFLNKKIVVNISNNSNISQKAIVYIYNFHRTSFSMN